MFYLPVSAWAQGDRPDMVFGKIDPALFAPEVYPIDSNADAVILFDKGLVHFEQPLYESVGFSIIYERHTRIRILHKNAFSLSTVTLARFRKMARGFKLENLKGATYNLEGGNLVQTALEKNNIFTEENGDFELQKIVLPAVREGSIIEYSYQVISPGLGYTPQWDFQWLYPVLWSEYDITIPSPIDYLTKKQGFLPYAIDTSILTSQHFQLNQSYNPRYQGLYTAAGRTDAREWIWAIRNLPAISTKENYLTTTKNYNSRIEFQLAALHLPNLDRTFTTNWRQVVDELMKNERFGAPLNDRNHWMKNELIAILGEEHDSLANAKQIYSYLRDHFECDRRESIYNSQPTRKTWEEKKGNVADINLLLTALLKYQGFAADPVILSTKAHGWAYEQTPLLMDYNYIIARLVIGNKIYLLDATRTTTGFGQLPEYCYNGNGRIIDESHRLVMLQPDSMTERRTTLVILANDSLGFSGRFSHQAGVFESMQIRDRLKKMKTEEFFDAVGKTFPPYKTMDENGIDSLNRPEDLLGWHYDMEYRLSSDIIYFNPILHDRITDNPFNDPERQYPVEFPYCEDFSYILNMEIPKGYEITDLPKSERIQLDEGKSAIFEYIIEKTDEGIQFQYRLRIKKTFFPLEEYQSLRDFFAFIIKKQKEQIVFKKK